MEADTSQASLPRDTPKRSIAPRKRYDAPCGAEVLTAARQRVGVARRAQDPLHTVGGEGPGRSRRGGRACGSKAGKGEE